VRWLLLAALVVAASCGSSAPAGPPPPVSGQILAAAERADDALRAAYASADPARLQGAIAGRALLIARNQVSQLSRGGGRREEQLESRREVHESVAGNRAEVVLLITARQRVVNANGPAAALAPVIRQWRATLELQNGGWVVVDDGDLPPAQWWPS
jgi:hypothetical protein